MSEAVKLSNRTTPITNDPGYYAVTLEVFHQLHCLVGSTSYIDEPLEILC